LKKIIEGRVTCVMIGKVTRPSYFSPPNTP